MTLTLLDCQKERIGRLIWANIDGVAKNVMPVLTALNADVATGVKVVAHDEWERCQDRLRVLHTLLADLESRTVEYSQEQIVGRLRALLRHDAPVVEPQS
jgi:hypothetical protein